MGRQAWRKDILLELIEARLGKTSIEKIVKKDITLMINHLCTTLEFVFPLGYQVYLFHMGKEYITDLVNKFSCSCYVNENFLNWKSF